MIPLQFLAEAQTEFEAAALYYASGSPGTSARFVQAVNRTITRIREYPHTRIREYPPLGSPRGDLERRTLVSGFPYQVVYRFDGQAIIIVAVAHLHRRPDYWHGRE